MEFYIAVNEAILTCSSYGNGADIGVGYEAVQSKQHRDMWEQEQLAYPIEQWEILVRIYAMGDM